MNIQYLIVVIFDEDMGLKRSSLYKNLGLLLTSISSISYNAEAVITVAPAGHIVTNQAGANDDFDFQNLGGDLTIDAAPVVPITFTNDFLQELNGRLRIATDFILSNDSNTINLSVITGKLGAFNTKMTIQNPTQPVTINSDFLIGGNSVNGSIANLYIYSKTELTSSTLQSTDILIGKSGSPQTLTLSPSTIHTTQTIAFGDPDSTLIFNTATLGSGQFDFPGNLAGSVYSDLFVRTLTDKSGIVEIDANNNPMALDFTIGSGIGENSSNRAKQLSIGGNAAVNIAGHVFAEEVVFKNSSSNITFEEDVNLGLAGKMTFMNDSDYSVSPGKKITAISPTLELGSNKVTLTSGDMTFSAMPNINVSMNPTTKQIGSLVVGTTGISTLDLNAVTTLTVTMNGTSALPTSGNEYSHFILSVGANGTLIPVAGNITFVDNEQNPAISWSYNSTTHELKSTTTIAQIVPVVSSSNASPAVISIAKALAATDNSAARELLNEITAESELSKLTLAEKISTLVPDNTTGNIVAEAQTTAEAAVINRMFEVPRHLNYTEENGIGVAAGDDAVTKYGVWASALYYFANQRKHDADPPYKLWNNGGTIGADYMVRDNITMGLAYTFVGSRMKQYDVKLGSRTRTQSHIFSLYGLVDLERDYFLSGIASYGVNNVKNYNIRRIGNAPTKTAFGKYKTLTASTSLLLGKKINWRNYIFIPNLGISAAIFRDDEYQESGAGIQNLTVSGKTTKSLEGVVGGKVAKDVDFGGYKLTTELNCNAHINLYNKKPVVFISNPAFANPVRIEGEKLNPVWYSIGAAINSIRDDLEIGLSYEAHIDKKYVGHQGTCKVRLNF